MRRTAALALLLLLTTTSALHAQLFSPGKLATPHASLEGLRSCTSCHELRQRGTSNALCLDCHKPLAARITANRGLHATYGTRSCGSCHRDHLGLDHRLVTLDTASFNHDTTGFILGGSHQDLGCRDCHKSARIAAADVKAWGAEHSTLSTTFLGLPVTCDGCHRSDAPHGTQFARRTCDACHDDLSWKEAAGFSHDRARFRLTGMHTSLACSACHKDTSTDPSKPRVTYTPIPSGTCNSCHTDPHNGAMGGGCTVCHNTTGWHNVAGAGLDGKFDHSRTHFPLVAAHTTVACATCHDARASARGDARATGIRITWAPGSAGSSFGKPVYASCVGCHVDRHAGTFAASPGGAVCTNCHGNDAWTPTTYDLARHNASTSRFALTGAHMAVPCTACHAAADSTHLTVFRIANTTCIACHATTDPHQGQFAGRTCESCHLTTTFALASFDHSKTRYPLDGAHRSVPCTSCHRTETAANGRTFRRFTPLGTTCRDCHGGTR